MTTYYRIQSAERNIDDLLTADGQTSTSWDNEDDTLEGVSACESIDELGAYLAGTGIPFGDGAWVLVEMEGDFHGYGHDGECLVIPTAIVSVTDLDDADELHEAIGRAWDAAN